MIARVCWVVLALVHLMPALALFRPALITRLYGAAPGSGNFVLLHHRAALFAVVLLVCLWAAVQPQVRMLATAAAGISMLSFLILYGQAGQPAALRTIALVDLCGLPFLALAAALALR
jgi:hypothetical protein